MDVDEASRGYVCEVFGGHFELPSLGPIGECLLGTYIQYLTEIIRLSKENS